MGCYSVSKADGIVYHTGMVIIIVHDFHKDQDPIHTSKSQIRALFSNHNGNCIVIGYLTFNLSLHTLLRSNFAANRVTSNQTSN